MIGDTDLKVAKLYDMLPGDAGNTSEGRTAGNNATVRSVFIIGPDKKIKAMLTYPMSTGPQLRRSAAPPGLCQLTAQPQGGDAGEPKPGEDVIIPPSVNDEQAQQKYPGGWKTRNPYPRIIPQPK